MSNLTGNLQSIALTDVLQLLSVNKRMGKLEVKGPEHTGVLYISNGEVIQAEFKELRGESAAFEILEWTKGTFEFFPVKVTAGVAIKRNLTDLMMEAARTTDSRRRLKALFPDRYFIPWPTMQDPELYQGLKIFSEEKKIIPFLDGYRDFYEIMSACGCNDVAVMQTASILKDAGRLKLFNPGKRVSISTMKTGLFKRGDHVEVAKVHEEEWRAMEPYAHGIINLRVLWLGGPAVERVQFVANMDPNTIAVPKDNYESWGLNEGTSVRIKPAP